MPSYHGQQSNQVRIWYDTQVQAYQLVTPYNEGFIATLKSLIPVSDRAWNKEARIWTITERYYQPVFVLCEQIWGKGCVSAVTKDQTRSAQSPAAVANAKIEDVMVQFFKLVPLEAMTKCYRTAAMLMHPDRGGDMEAMSKLNAMWQRLEEEFYKSKK